MGYTYTVTREGKLNFRISVRHEERQMSWAIFTSNGELIKANGNDIVFLPFPDELKANAKEIIKALPEDKFAGSDVYLRFNELPKSGASTNWSTGQLVKKKKVYPLTKHDTTS